MPLGASPDAMLRPTPDAPLQVVEVKNVCPFVPLGKKNRDASEGEPQFGLFASYVSEAEGRAETPFWTLRGPHERLPCQYVPQVMVEMLVTGAAQATYVSASATQGINLFRVERDDEYIAELLYFLSAFWASVRRWDVPPTDDFFWDLEAASGDQRRSRQRYRRFLLRTRQIGERTRVERHIAQPWRRDASGAGQLFFLD